MDLEVGTALFSRRTDVHRWNQACVHQIDSKYGPTKCEAVDVHGFDPLAVGGDDAMEAKLHKQGKGLQTPLVLQLRTCPQHRMRLMLLCNLDLKNQWANGTRLRLLESNAWTGIPRLMEEVTGVDRGKGAQWQVQQVYLRDTTRYREFNIKVVRDEECTITMKVRFGSDNLHMVPAQFVKMFLCLTPHEEKFIKFDH